VGGWGGIGHRVVHHKASSGLAPSLLCPQCHTITITIALTMPALSVLYDTQTRTSDIPTHTHTHSGLAEQAQDSLNAILRMQPNNFKALLKRAGGSIYGYILS